MTNIIKIKLLKKIDIYRDDYIFPDKYLILSEFLTVDVATFSWLEMAQENLAFEGRDHNANVCCAERKGDNIILWHWYVEIYPDLVIPYIQFAKLLDAWRQVLEKRPQNITIKFDDEYNFELEYCMLDDTYVRIKS